MDLVYLFARWPEWARSWIINTKQKKEKKKSSNEGFKKDQYYIVATL